MSIVILAKIMSRRRQYVMLWRALLLWAVLFILFLLHYAWRLHRSPGSPYVTIRVEGGAYVEQVYPVAPKEGADEKDCPEARLLPGGGKVLDAPTPEPVACQMAPRSCQMANKLFGVNATTAQCGERNHVFCSVRSLEHGVYTVNCTHPKSCLEEYAVGLFDPNVADVVWRNFTSMDAIRDHLQEMLTLRHLGFAFLRCRLKHAMEESEEADFYDSNVYPQYVDYSKSYGVQLLILPPSVTRPKSPRRVSVNLVMIDSVSHPHFYRSLPLTVSKLEEIAFRATVLDFKMFQAIKHRTYESLQALFSGHVDVHEKHAFGTHDMPPRPLPVERLFGMFRKAGYTTLWLEDLCWTWEWGLAKDLLVHTVGASRTERYRRLVSALGRANIQEVAVTLASCHVLEWNGRRDPFHGPPAVCFNGRHHHEYLLEYLRYYQTQMELKRRPYLSFMTTSVSHEDTGLRIRTLDASLAAFLDSAARLPSTLTVLFSDHGNAYGTYVSKSVAGRLETYHPFMFLIVPKLVWNALTEQDQQNLLVNQNKLVTLIDVHYMLRHLVSGKRVTDAFSRKYVVNRGLFGAIPANRTCDDVPRLLPSVCMCDGYETSVDASDDKLLLAEHAIGTLNNVLWVQKKSPRCQQLVGDRVENVREVANDRSKTVKMDIRVSSYDGTIRNEIFTVAVKVSLTGQGCQLVGFERLTAYAQFSICSDPSVNLKLCLCTRFKRDVLHRLHSIFKTVFGTKHNMAPRRHFGVETEVTSLLTKDGVQCLMLLKRKYSAGVAFQLENKCANALHLAFDVELVNMIPSVPLPLEVLVEPGVTLFLLSLIQLDEKQYWTWKFSIKYIPH